MTDLLYAAAVRVGSVLGWALGLAGSLLGRPYPLHRGALVADDAGALWVVEIVDARTAALTSVDTDGRRFIALVERDAFSVDGPWRVVH